MQQDKYRRRLEEDTAPMHPVRLFDLVFHLRPAVPPSVTVKEMTQGGEGKKNTLFFQKRVGIFHFNQSQSLRLSINVTSLDVTLSLVSVTVSQI